jgi:hypothetical protein
LPIYLAVQILVTCRLSSNKLIIRLFNINFSLSDIILSLFCRKTIFNWRSLTDCFKAQNFFLISWFRLNVSLLKLRTLIFTKSTTRISLKTTTICFYSSFINVIKLIINYELLLIVNSSNRTFRSNRRLYFINKILLNLTKMS